MTKSLETHFLQLYGIRKTHKYHIHHLSLTFNIGKTYGTNNYHITYDTLSISVKKYEKKLFPKLNILFERDLGKCLGICQPAVDCFGMFIYFFLDFFPRQEKQPFSRNNS